MSQTDRKFEQSHRVCLNKQGIYKHLLCCILLLNDCHNYLIKDAFYFFWLSLSYEIYKTFMQYVIFSGACLPSSLSYFVPVENT